MKSFLLFICAAFLLQTCHAQVNEAATTITSIKTTTPTAIKIGENLKGNLNTGQVIDLDWAQLSNVACFPGNKFFEFQGNHVFYALEIEPKSTTVISLEPLGKKSRINLYALRLSSGNMVIPPNVQRCISCEAKYPAYHGTPNLNLKSSTKEIEFDAISKPYTILIAVAGAKGVLEGEFELSVRKK